jgi:hypothetical protein
MVNFCVIQSTLVPVLWDKFSKYLEPVVDVSCGELTLDTIKLHMQNNMCTTILVVEGTEILGVCTTELHTFDSGLKALYVPIIGGMRIDDWGLDFFKSCEELARTIGCTEIRGQACRQGWLRKLAQHNLNWKRCYEVISYELN